MNAIQNLPDDVMSHVLSFSDPISLVRSSAVNRSWNCVAKDDHTWQNLSVKSTQQVLEKFRTFKDALPLNQTGTFICRLYKNGEQRQWVQMKFQGDQEASQIKEVCMFLIPNDFKSDINNLKGFITQAERAADAEQEIHRLGYPDSSERMMMLSLNIEPENMLRASRLLPQLVTMIEHVQRDIAEAVNAAFANAEEANALVEAEPLPVIAQPAIVERNVPTLWPRYAQIAFVVTIALAWMWHS